MFKTELLAQRLSEPLPGGAAHRTMSSQLAYGRHRGPAPADTRLAAVAIAILASPTRGPWVPLTVRPRALRHHGGQVSLPGGRVELGESVVEAATREFREELGPAEEISFHLLGLLSPVYVYGSHNLVTPVVFTADEPTSFTPDPLEVEAVVPLQLGELLQPERRGIRTMRRNMQCEVNPSAAELHWRAPYWQIGDHEVWGATAMILAELAAVLQAETVG